MTAHASHGSIAINRAAFHAAPRRPVTWPHQVGVLPRQADYFQDRRAAAQLEQAMADGGTAVLCQVLAGMGGVGKTQLAARHARALWRAGDLDLLVWVTAATPAAIVSGYAQAAVEILDADPANPERAAERFLAWLEPIPSTARLRWMVVLDDLADPADLRGLWPPSSTNGRILITTRRRDEILQGDGRRLVPVGLFTEQEAVAYLTATLGGHNRHAPADELASLAVDLGHLPLALSQAAAYVIDTNLECATYRRLLADRARTLTEVLPGPSGLADDQATTVAAAWSLSIDRADQLPPRGLARPTLQLAAMLNPNGMPTSVLVGAPALQYLAEQATRPVGPTDVSQAEPRRRWWWPRAQRRSGPTHVTPAPATAEEALQALRALHRLSLIDYTPNDEHQAVRLHQLIQRAARDALTPDQHAHCARTAADALVAAWPEIERHTALAQSFRANAADLTRHAEEVLYQSDGAHAVLFRAGQSLGEAGQVAAATDHFQHLASTAHDCLGPDHRDTLRARGNLAHFRGEAGDVAGAVTAFEQLLPDRERVLGPDHLHTLATRGNLALRRGEAGDASGAATAYAELLHDYQRVLGPDHPDTLRARDSLAYFRGEAGDASGAATAYVELLHDYQRVLGPDHPRTLALRHNLAHFRGEAGDVAGAVTAFEQLLPDYERVLGPDHLHTLRTRGNLALRRGEAGDASGAATAYAELLHDYQRVLGPDHPDTLRARHHLAHFRGEAGDVAGAVTAFEQLLPDYERVLGPDHLHTLRARGNLALRRGEAGDASGAATAYAELLHDYQRVLGPDHPRTLAPRHNLAHYRGEAGDVAGAVAAFEQLLPDYQRVLGPDHPETLRARGNLALRRGDAGDVAGAVTAFEQLLYDYQRVLGPDHPETLRARGNLALWQGKAKSGGVQQSTDS